MKHHSTGYFEFLVPMARKMCKEGKRLDAIRFFRSKGISFQPAKTYVDEIAAGKPWWRHYR